MNLKLLAKIQRQIVIKEKIGAGQLNSRHDYQLQMRGCGHNLIFHITQLTWRLSSLEGVSWDDGERSNQLSKAVVSQKVLPY